VEGLERGRGSGGSFGDGMGVPSAGGGVAGRGVRARDEVRSEKESCGGSLRGLFTAETAAVSRACGSGARTAVSSSRTRWLSGTGRAARRFCSPGVAEWRVSECPHCSSFSTPRAFYIDALRCSYIDEVEQCGGPRSRRWRCDELGEWGRWPWRTHRLDALLGLLEDFELYVVLGSSKAFFAQLVLIRVPSSSQGDHGGAEQQMFRHAWMLVEMRIDLKPPFGLTSFRRPSASH
jgi:hypothetical protein